MSLFRNITRTRTHLKPAAGDLTREPNLLPEEASVTGFMRAINFALPTRSIEFCVEVRF
jgi:hypothetical protein